MVTPWLIDHVDNIYANSRQIQKQFSPSIRAKRSLPHKKSGYFKGTPHNHQAFPLDFQSETGNARNLKNPSLNATTKNLHHQKQKEPPINLLKNRGVI
ncbi:hypothetical protein C2U32_13120 [Acinetobacter baumannii]|nr:hypothetical protein G424_16490 [Acinetobacter baumannii PR07]AUT38861.1 hypothetical protein C2U32_13120 [Acinetobacter baumannii]KRJ34894.1 hypothetical protein APC83_06240 [Acinetobacter baumannii]